MKIKVLLADDHVIVLEGLNAVLNAQENIEVCGQVCNGQEVLDFVKLHSVDIAVLDINMPVMDGMTCARRLRKEFPLIKIIVLTMYAQKSFIEEIIKIGIDGCLLKNNTGKELRDAIIRVMDGRSYFDQVKHFHETPASEQMQYNLSDREISIIKLLAEGCTSHQVAEKLFISEHTVKTHRKNILRKTGINSTSQLVQFALNNGLMN